MTKGTRNVVIIFGVILCLIIIATVIFVSVDLNREPEFTIDGNVLKVSDTYAKSISLEGAEITVIDKVPALARRIVGTSAGNLKKGRYALASGEEVYFSLVRADMKCILVDNGKKYYINCKSEEKTLALYERLISFVTGEDEY